MFRQFGTGEILLILAVVLLLFGAKRLPDTARGLGRSLRIFRAETKGMMSDDEGQSTPPEAPRQIPAKPGDVADVTGAETRPTEVNPGER